MKAEHDSQIILYCKRGWFKRGETFEEQLEDLKKIIAEVYLLYVEDISIDDVRSNLVDIVFKYQSLHNKSPVTFINEISPEKFYQFAADRHTDGIKYIGRPHPDYDFDRAVICKCMSVISCIRVGSGDSRVLFMDPPDYTIMPPFDDSIKEKVERYEREGQWATY